MDSHHDPLEILTRVANEMEAMIVVNALERCGIRAVATGGYTSGLKAEAPTDVQVRVLKSTLDEARQALTELRQSRADDPLDSA
jgi:tRNA G26 N,N-dimethylase Trm1